MLVCGSRLKFAVIESIRSRSRLDCGKERYAPLNGEFHYGYEVQTKNVDEEKKGRGLIALSHLFIQYCLLLSIL